METQSPKVRKRVLPIQKARFITDAIYNEKFIKESDDFIVVMFSEGYTHSGFASVIRKDFKNRYYNALYNVEWKKKSPTEIALRVVRD